MKKVKFKILHKKLIFFLIICLLLLIIKKIYFNTPTLELGREICILDDTDNQRMVAELKEELNKKFYMPVIVRKNPFNLNFAYDSFRGQYNYEKIVKTLNNFIHGDKGKAILLTDKDTFGTNLNWSTGYSLINGNVILVSAHRLDPYYWTNKKNDKLFIERVKKILFHEIGHSFGIYWHCQDWNCIMRNTNSIEDIDKQGMEYQGICRKFFLNLPEQKYILEKTFLNHVKILSSITYKKNNDIKVGRPNYSMGLQKAFKYIRNTLKKYGYTPFIDKWQQDGKAMQNLMTNKRGYENPEKAIIFTAHLDTVESTPGADDNASGVAILLTLAKEISKSYYKNSVEFVFFSGEEIGFLGSRRYVEKLMHSKKQVKAIINIDQAAYNADRVPVVLVHIGRKKEAADVGRQFIKAAADWNTGLKPVIMDIQSYITNDAIYFWKYKYPAITITEDFRGDWSTAYHTLKDTIDTLDPAYAQKIIITLFGFLEQTAGIYTEKVNQ